MNEGHLQSLVTQVTPQEDQPVLTINTAFDIIVLQSYIVNWECQTFLHLGVSILHQIKC